MEILHSSLFIDYLGYSMMHVGHGRQHPLHVEYVHIGACLGFIQTVLTEALLSHPRLHLSRKMALITAIGKVIWVQNDLFAKWYVRDGNEYTEESDHINLEFEGYLHGKQIIAGEKSDEGCVGGYENKSECNNDDDDGYDHQTTAPASSSPGNQKGMCPFSNKTSTRMMAQDMENLHLTTLPQQTT